MNTLKTTGLIALLMSLLYGTGVMSYEGDNIKSNLQNTAPKTDLTDPP